jgi:hypothetical protein
MGREYYWPHTCLTDFPPTSFITAKEKKLEKTVDISFLLFIFAPYITIM